MNEESNPSQMKNDSASGFAVLRLLCRTFAKSVEPILHTGLGARYMGPGALLVIPLALIFGILWPDQDPRPLLGFLGGWFFAVFCNRVSGWRTRARGESPPHSYYNGTPRLSRWLPRISEWTMKRVIEPAIVAFAAVAVGGWNRPLSSYLWCCSASLVITLAMHDLNQQYRTQDAYDALIEQRIFRERFDRLTGNRR